MQQSLETLEALGFTLPSPAYLVGAGLSIAVWFDLR
jgi:hypothetical protein